MAIVGGLGYDGLWLDRFGFGPEIAVVEPSLGQPSLTSADGRFVVYDLRPLESVLDDLVNRSEIRSLVDAALDNDASDSLASLTATFGRGFRGEEAIGSRTYSWAPSSARLDLRNPTNRARVVLSWCSGQRVP